MSEMLQAPRVLPWGLVFGLVGASAAFAVPTFYWAGMGGLIAALAALAPALAGRALAPPNNTWFGGAVLLAGLLAETILPGQITVWLVAFLLCTLAGIEAATTGGRAAVLTLYGWAALAVLPGAPAPIDALPVVASGFIWAALVAPFIGLGPFASIPPARWQFGVALTLFLSLGLLIATGLANVLNDPHAYWVILLFIFRALAPPTRGLHSAFRFVAGAVAGAFVAYVLSAADLPAPVSLGLATMLTVIGLRHLPHPRPYAAGAFTAALLLMMSAGPELVVFRTQTALLSAGLAAGLVVLIGGAWKLLARVYSGGTG